MARPGHWGRQQVGIRSCTPTITHDHVEVPHNASPRSRKERMREMSSPRKLTIVPTSAMSGTRAEPTPHWALAAIKRLSKHLCKDRRVAERQDTKTSAVRACSGYGANRDRTGDLLLAKRHGETASELYLMCICGDIRLRAALADPVGLGTIRRVCGCMTSIRASAGYRSRTRRAPRRRPSCGRAWSRCTVNTGLLPRVRIRPPPDLLGTVGRAARDRTRDQPDQPDHRRDLGRVLLHSASVEEKNLTATFPTADPAYRTSTKMLIPFVL
jgi:hypothetical protein